MNARVKGDVRSFVVYAVAALSLSSCTSTVQTIAKVQPKYAEAAELRRVAVLGFQGREAGVVNAAFETMLVNHRFDDAPYFTVVDRAATRALMQEYGRSLRGEIEAATAAQFGRQIGAEGVYFGDITQADMHTRRYRGVESRCVRFKDGKCKDRRMQEVSCRERIAAITLVPRLVDVETAQVVYRSQHVGTSSDSACGGGGLAPDDTLMQQAVTQAVAKIRADVAPQAVLTSVRLMEDPSNLREHGAEEFEKGLAFAKEERMDRACQIWRQLNEKTQGIDNALVYNIAVCEEAEGDYEEALELFQQVDMRLDRPDKNVSDALARVKTTLAAQ